MLHTINPEILFLKQEDVIKAGLLDMKQILAVTEKTYAMLGQGLIKNPPKTNTSIPDKENWQSFFNAMPCYIGGDILENPNNVRLYANSSSSLSLESNITGQIERILEAEKLKAYNIENLSQILDEVKTSVNRQTCRNDKSQEEDTQAQSSAVATGVGYVLGFILYMFLLIYGSMVMQSVIEEKNNRVLEVMVSSVRPFDLMMGKILGVASVAIVQVLLWGALIAGVGALVMPHLMPEDVMASAQAMQQGMPDAASMSDMNPEMLQAVAAMTDLGYIFKIFASLLLFVFGGYLL